MTALHWYVVEPLDVLLFREAKPFSPGSGSWAKGLFPPLPITVFQALRSLLDQDKTPTRRLEFLGPFLLDSQDDLWLPTPKDLLAIKETKSSPTNGQAQEDPEDNFETQRQDWTATCCLEPITNHKYVFADNLPVMVPPPLDKNQHICGRPAPWIRLSALTQYLKGELPKNPDDFCIDPWASQVLPHILIQPDQRQVAEEAGYFTEVAVRLKPGWRMVCALDALMPKTTVRLGGEGHRALVYPAPPALVQASKTLTTFEQQPGHNRAYLLTPGLAEARPSVYGVTPQLWQKNLAGCVSERALLWGGVSTIRRKVGSDKTSAPEFALSPQRAYVPPGTIYLFKDPPPFNGPLLPTRDTPWLATLHALNYGKLLWSKRP